MGLFFWYLIFTQLLKTKPVSEFFTQRFYQIRRNKSENYSFVLLKSAKWTWFHRFKKYSALVLKKNSRNNSLGTLPKFISKVQHRMVLRQIDFWYSTRDSPIDKHHVIITGIPQWHHVILKFCDSWSVFASAWCIDYDSFGFSFP